MNNYVLDVTEFKHPGPQKLITENIGKDITKLFEENEHSNYARELADRLAIGYLGQGKLLHNSFVENLTEEEQEIHARLDKLIDVKKPLIPQVKKLTNKEFQMLIKRPRFVDGEDSIQMFEDKAQDQAHKRDYEKNKLFITPSIFFYLLIAYMMSDST